MGLSLHNVKKTVIFIVILFEYSSQKRVFHLKFIKYYNEVKISVFLGFLNLLN
jgi:hypothetical protein